MKLENKIIEATLGENLPEVIIEKEEDFRNLLGNSDIVFYEQETEDISSYIENEMEDEEDLDEEYDDKEDSYDFPNLRRPNDINKYKLTVAKQNNIAENLFKKIKEIENKANETASKIKSLEDQEKEKIQQLFEDEMKNEDYEILAYNVYSFIKNGIAYVYEEPIEKYLKLKEINDEYNELINTIKEDSNKIDYFSFRRELREISEKIVTEVNKWYQDNKKQIEEELENTIVCEDFCKCTNKTTRKNYFETNIKDLKFWCYPYLTDALENIYKKHKNDFK